MLVSQSESVDPRRRRWVYQGAFWGSPAVRTLITVGAAVVVTVMAGRVPVESGAARHFWRLPSS